jgi:hypothetical protein
MGATTRWVKVSQMTKRSCDDVCVHVLSRRQISYTPNVSIRIFESVLSIANLSHRSTVHESAFLIQLNAICVHENHMYSHCQLNVINVYPSMLFFG